MSRVALTLLLLTAGCSAERLALRRDRHQSIDLGARAQRCWDLVRWSDPEATACVEGDDNRLAYQDFLRARARDERIEDVAVLHVSVTPEKNPPGDDGHIREAEVTIREDAYHMPEQVLHSETFQQHWYELKSGWYLEWP